MSALGSLVASIRLEHAQYTAGLAKADQETLQKAQNIQRNLDGLARAAEQSDTRMAASMERAAQTANRGQQMIANFARTAVAAFSVGQIIRTADEFGQLQSRLEGATRSHAEYVAVQERLLEVSGRVYRGLGESVEMFTRTAESLRQVGYESKDAADLVATLNYALTVNSADAQKTASVVNAFSSAILTGKMNTQQFNSVIAASPRLQQAMADALGTTNAGLMAMVQSGGLSVHQLMAVVSQMDKVGSEADKMKTSVGDALTSAGTQFGVWVNRLNDATGATDYLVSGIDLVVKNLDEIAMVGAITAGPLLIRQFGLMAGAALSSAAAVGRDTLALISNTATSVQKARVAAMVAKEDHARALAALAVARAEFEAARGTGAHAFALEALMRAQTQANVTGAAAAAAQGGLATAVRATAGFLGGPAGLITLGATAAAGWLLFRNNTNEAAVALTDLQGPMDDVISKFKAMNELQRERAIGLLGEEVAEAAKVVQASRRELENAFKPSTAAGGKAAADMRAAFNAELRGIVQDTSLTADEAANTMLRLIDTHVRAVGGNEQYRASLVAVASTLGENLGKLRDSEGRLQGVTRAQAEAAASAKELGRGMGEIATGMAQADWDKYLRELTDARDVIGMTARELTMFQAIGRGANEEQARLAGIVGAQASEYRNLEKAIQDKDKKATEGARKRLQELAEEEAKVQALIARTAVLARTQAMIAEGALMIDVMSEADAAGRAAYQKTLEQFNEQIRRLEHNTSPSGSRGAGSRSESEGAKLLKAINERIDALKAEALAYGQVSKAQRDLMEFEQRLARTKDASLKQNADQIRLGYMLADMQETANRRAEMGRKLQEQYTDSILDQNASLYESYFRLQDQVSTWAADEVHAARNMEALEQARVRERIATEEQALARLRLRTEAKEEIRTSEEALAALNSQLEVRQKLAWLNETARDQARQRQAIQAQAQQWGQVLDGLRQNFQEGFFAALGDQDALSSFGDSLKRTAKTALASAAHEAFAKPIFVRVIAELAGLTGGADVRHQILQQAGLDRQSGQGLNWGSTASRMLYGSGALPGSVAYANWAAAAPGSAAYAAGGDGLSQLIAANPQWTSGGLAGWFSNAPASSMFSLGGYNSATGMSSAAGGLATAGAGLIGGYLGGAMWGNKGQSAMGGGLGASAGMMIGTSSAVASTAIGAQLGAAAGPIGAAIGMVIGSALGSLIGSGETRYGGGYTVGTDGRYFRSGGPSGGDPNEAQTIQTVTGVRDSVAELAARLGGDASNLHFGAGYELSPDKGRSFVWSDWVSGSDELSWQRGMRDLSGVKDPEQVAAEFAVEMQRAVLRGLQMSGLDGAFADYLGQFDIASLDEAGVAAVTANLDAMLQFRDALQRLPFADLAGIALDAGLKLAQFSGGIEPLLANMQTYYDLTHSAEEKALHLQQQLVEAFQAMGYEMPNSIQGLRELVEGLDTTTDAGLKARAEMYALAGAFGQLQDMLADLGAGAGDAAAEMNAAFDAQIGIVRALTQEAARLDGILSTAGGTLDRIAQALSRTAQYGPVREAALWAQLATAGYEQQVALSSELTGIVLDRISAEQQAAQAQIDALTRQADIARGLGQYLDSLRTGDLSPLTLGERVAESEQQLAEAVAQARAGDTDALARVQQLTEQTLRLWREYGASGADYQAAYARITGMVGDLASQQLSEAERQIALHEQAIGISEESRQQLEQLYGTAERAYAVLDQQYQAAQQAAQAEMAKLTELGINTGRLHDIAGLLQGMPAGIAAALQPVLSAAMGSVVSGWYQEAGYGQGDQEGRDYWTGQLGQQPQEQVRDGFLAGIITQWYRETLGREPDGNGMAWWLAVAKSEGVAQAHQSFLGSAKYEIDGSHREGLWSVPRDGYLAELHRGEIVLPQPEARRYRALEAMADRAPERRGGFQPTQAGSDEALLREVRQIVENGRALLAEAQAQRETTVAAGSHLAQVIVTASDDNAKKYKDAFERARSDELMQYKMRRHGLFDR